MADAGGGDKAKPLGFWSCWSLTAGTMIGSGIFLLPAVLAPYGLLSFGGWLISGAGSILLALTIGRLAARTTRIGGPYVYTQDAFGDFVGYLSAWGYWCSYWLAIPAIAIAFVGYLTVFAPALSESAPLQCAAGLALIWTLALVNMRGLRETAAAQLVMTVLKLVPLLAIIALGFALGAPSNLPAFNPSGASLPAGLAACALLTTWAFSGLECGALPAANVRDAKRTIPRAVIAGTVAVTLVYLMSTAAVMLLLPPEAVRTSTAPFADAARMFGAWGPSLVAAGALVATAGALNGCIFVAGQLPLAVALDRLAPSFFARRTTDGAPYLAVLVSCLLGSALLVANYTRGLIGAFTFLLMMATVTALGPLLLSAVAELRHSWRSAAGWSGVALLAAAYIAFAIVGSGWEVMAWGAVLIAAGAPLFVVSRQRSASPAAASD